LGGELRDFLRTSLAGKPNAIGRKIFAEWTQIKGIGVSG
jgi:hypothetical protein